MRKKEVIEVETKREWNFIAKFYFVCIIIFVLLVAYIVIYRYAHWDEVQDNIKSSSNDNQEIVENTIEDKVAEIAEEIQVADAGVITEEEKTISDENFTDTSEKTTNQNIKETQEKKAQVVNPSTTQKQTQTTTSNPSTTIQSNPKQTATETKTVPVQENNNKPTESFKVNNTLINQMKSIINSNPSTYMKQFGYNIVVDSSIVNQTTGFTFTETRVKNAIVNSFGTIRIYARDYYVGNELRWTESFIL